MTVAEWQMHYALSVMSLDQKVREVTVHREDEKVGRIYLFPPEPEVNIMPLMIHGYVEEIV